MPNHSRLARLPIRGIRYHIVIVFVFLSHPLLLFATDGWNFITEDDGIALYSRTLKGYASTEFKGICIIDRPIESVGTVLSEVSAYPEWFFRCTQSYKIRAKNSSDLNFLLYVAIDTPWPFADRYVVYKVVSAVDRTAGKIVVSSTAIQAPTALPQNDTVRITDSELKWILEKLPDGQTRLTFINRTHAAGAAGDFISIRGTRATTLHSLKNLKKQLS
jgi:hypothetical protein